MTSAHQNRSFADRKPYGIRPEEMRFGARVRVAHHHDVKKRRGMVGRVVARYGGPKYVVAEVLFPSGEKRLFRTTDLTKASRPRPWLR